MTAMVAIAAEAMARTGRINADTTGNAEDGVKGGMGGKGKG